MKADNFSEEGAKALARVIRDHWEARGYTITTTVVPVHMGSASDGKGVIWGVRSNMVNGAPVPA